MVVKTPVRGAMLAGSVHWKSQGVATPGLSQLES
jgi:hypothetical protein